jgi:hypothetical protein
MGTNYLGFVPGSPIATDYGLSVGTVFRALCLEFRGSKSPICE